jgi:hypothetical protein
MIGDPPTCTCCLFGHRNDGDQHRQRVLAALAERVRLGRSLGNDRAVEYPSGIGLGLRNVLDDLRRFLVVARVELQVEGEVVVHDGHLRRVDDGGGEGDYLMYWPGSLGFFANPDDPEPHATLLEDDYDRIVRVSVIDRLLIACLEPHVVWEASEVKRAEWDAQRAARGRRERWLAVLFFTHLLVVLTVVVGGFVPVFVVWREGRALGAVARGLVWFLASVIIGSSLGAWEQFPNLTTRWSDDDGHG